MNLIVFILMLFNGDNNFQYFEKFEEISMPTMYIVATSKEVITSTDIAEESIRIFEKYVPKEIN